MRTKTFSLLTLFLSTLLLASCATQEVEIVEENETPVQEDAESTSSVETQTYTSERYAVSFEYPDGWNVFDDASQLDVQSPEGRPSNYFTLDPEDSIIYEDPTLEELIEKWSLKKADFTIDGQDVYTSGEKEDSVLLSFYFEHNNMVYALRSSTTWFEMPEVQLMISSLKLL